MNELISFINDRINRFLKKSDVVNTTPAIIKTVENKEWATVEILTNGAIYKLKNLSGTNLTEGQGCQVYYSKFLSQDNAYIGAATINESVDLNYVYGDKITGSLFEEEREISEINFTVNNNNTAILISYTIDVQGDSLDGICSFRICVDNEYLDRIVRCSVSNGELNTVSFIYPITVNSGVHQIVIFGQGNGVVNESTSFVYGNGIKEYNVYDPTDESDYIYDNDSNIIYYIGESNRPAVPTTLNGKSVEKILATGFNYKEVTSVYIPEGIVEIE